MKILIIIIILVLIACIFMATKKKKFEISEYDKLFNSINDMSYDELDRIHRELIPLCEELIFVSPHYIDEYGELVCDCSPEEDTRNLNNKLSATLPVEKQIYCCKTFGDADKLNQAILKRLNELDKR